MNQSRGPNLYLPLTDPIPNERSKACFRNGVFLNQNETLNISTRMLIHSFIRAFVHSCVRSFVLSFVLSFRILSDNRSIDSLKVSYPQRAI
jgi:hypothetical protein